jgi:hypothetical protein
MPKPKTHTFEENAKILGRVAIDLEQLASEKQDNINSKMKFSHGVGNINIKNIWDIQHIKKLTDDLLDSQMSVTSHIPSSIFFENQL